MVAIDPKLGLGEEMSPENNLTNYGRVTVVGAGVTGQAVAKVLARENKEVFVTDKGKIPEDARQKFSKDRVQFEQNGHTEKSLETDLVIVSPGVPMDNSVVEGAKSRSLPVIGEIELAYWLSRTDKIVAVTGTNGKTTTVKLITSIFKHQGKSAVACGNIGTPFVEIAGSLTSSDIPVVEVSSYQLQTIVDFKPKVGVLLNVTPDHLKRHGSFESYKQTKLRIFRNQDESCYSVINENLDLDPPNTKPELIRFQRRTHSGVNLLAHQRENFGAAVQAADCITQVGEIDRVPPTIVKRGFEIPHRLEPVAQVQRRQFVNDSKATNPAATIAAIDGFNDPIRLLLGGQLKLSGYDSLIRAIKRSSVRSVYLFGAARKKIESIMSEQEFESHFSFSSLQEATKEAFLQSQPGEVILLSPGCSSFDQFTDYKQRGREFVQTINSL